MAEKTAFAELSILECKCMIHKTTKKWFIFGKTLLYKIIVKVKYLAKEHYTLTRTALVEPDLLNLLAQPLGNPASHSNQAKKHLSLIVVVIVSATDLRQETEEN